MKLKSNIMPATAIYPIVSQADTNFLSAIHGRGNIEKLLRKKFHSVDKRVYSRQLTSVQVEEYELTTPCPDLKDDEELVWGIINTAEGLRLRCRCYKNDCAKYSLLCKQYNPENVVLSSLAPEFKTDPIDVKMAPKLSIDFGESKSASNLKTYVFLPEVISKTYGPKMKAILPTEPEDEQTISRIIYSKINERQYVTAPPGAGKTHNLIEKLKHLSTEYNAASSILVLCYTRAAVSEIQTRLSEAVEKQRLHDDTKRIYIVTFDSFATRVLLARNVKITGLNYDERIEMAGKEIRKDNSILDEVRHFIIDETQDLVGVRAALVKNMLEAIGGETGITFFGDPLQGIYDYEIRNKPGMITSVELNKEINSRFTDLEHLLLKQNHRQIETLKRFSSNCRLLLGSRKLDAFFDQISTIQTAGEVKSLHRISYPQDEITAILCRNNGEVLSISDQMNAYGIKHIVRRKEEMLLYPDWLVQVFSEQSDIVDREMFRTILSDRFSDLATIDLIFNEISESERGNGEYIFLNNLKRALQKGEDLNAPFEIEKSNIILSTIHQAKGREFDNVILIQSNMTQRESELFDEAKVYYVGITRARKRLLRAEASDQRAYFASKYSPSGRFTEIEMRNDFRKILRIEVGKVGDLDFQSFVDKAIIENAEENQRYILETFKVHKSVDLFLDQSQNPPLYKIMLDGRCVGAMSLLFTNDISSTFYQATSRSAPKYIEDIAIDRLISVVLPQETFRISLSKDAINRGVWYGLKLSGLGIPR